MLKVVPMSTVHPIFKFTLHIQLLTVESAVDIGSGLRWGEETVLCL